MHDAKGADQCFLKHILGISAIPGEGHRDPKKFPGMTVHQLVK
jgi:hypothetical protein